MSRQIHLVEVTEEQLYRFHKSRLAAAAVVLVFFSAFIVFAPEVDPKTTVPEVTAAASGGSE
jgi:hypothetical protein